MVWSCKAAGAGGELWIDDATGQMVSFTYSMGDSAPDASDRRMLTNHWGEFLEEYYGLSALNTGDYFVTDSGSSNSQCVWEMTWERGGETVSCSFALVTRGNTVYVNP